MTAQQGHLTAVSRSVGPEPTWYMGVCEPCTWFGDQRGDELSAREDIDQHEAGPVIRRTVLPALPPYIESPAVQPGPPVLA